MKQKEQRIGVFVDVQNLYYSAKHLYNSKVNFKEILRVAVNSRKLIRAIAYVIKADIRDEGNFFDALENIGFEVKSKDLQIFYGGAKKGDWDVGIAMDTIELSPKLDVIVLISGDGDFVPLVEHLKRAMGCRVEVIAFGRSTSAKLIEAVDEFVNLDKNSKNYVIEQKTEPKAAAKNRSPHHKKQGFRQRRDETLPAKKSVNIGGHIEYETLECDEE